MEKYLKIAKSQSRKSERQIRIGCVLVSKNKVLSKAHNTSKSHPLQKRLNQLRFDDEYFDSCDHTQHAEFKCLIKYYNEGKDLSKSTLFVYRENRKGEIGNCKPCNACSWLIGQLRIKRVVYIDELKKIKIDKINI